MIDAAVDASVSISATNVHHWLVLPFQIKGIITFHLHYVARQVAQQKQALLRRDGIVHVNLGAIKISVSALSISRLTRCEITLVRSLVLSHILPTSHLKVS